VEEEEEVEVVVVVVVVKKVEEEKQQKEKEEEYDHGNGGKDETKCRGGPPTTRTCRARRSRRRAVTCEGHGGKTQTGSLCHRGPLRVSVRACVRTNERAGWLVRECDEDGTSEWASKRKREQSGRERDGESRYW